MAPVFHIGIGALAALGIILWLAYRLRALRRQISNKCRLGELILKKIDAYVLLIDREFDVQMTNFYSLTDTLQPRQMPKPGNLLRCKNGEDAGQCGQHALCMDCPIRNAGEKAFRERKGFSEVETSMTLYTSDAHTQTAELEVSVSGSYLEFEGKPHLLLTIHDITSQKQIQRELEEARIRVERADRTKTIFLTNTSHEFRTQINAIIGFSELLGGGNLHLGGVPGVCRGHPQKQQFPVADGRRPARPGEDRNRHVQNRKRRCRTLRFHAGVGT